MPAKKPKPIAPGTLRIRTKDLAIVEKTKTGWKKSTKRLPNAKKVIKAFKKHNNFDSLISKEPKFLKGQLSPDGKVQGARLTILPNGEKLDKAYSLFSPELIIHDQSSHDHWDVLYKNPGGTYAYVYTQEKKLQQKKSKYKKVDKFKKHFPKLKRNATKALKDVEDHLAVPMITLLKTYMRVGSEIYFKTHGHKGLTTLQKKDIKIKGNNITFDFIAKDGVPVTITEEFSPSYMKRLKQHIKKLKPKDFIFTTSTGAHPLHDTHFKAAFKKYCGEEFYPHIVRSYFATTEVEKFLAKKTETTKKEAQELFTKIAHKLGHRKFDKKTQKWKDSYSVTLNHYIQPEVLEKIKSIIK